MIARCLRTHTARDWKVGGRHDIKHLENHTANSPQLKVAALQCQPRYATTYMTLCTVSLSGSVCASRGISVSDRPLLARTHPSWRGTSFSARRFGADRYEVRASGRAFCSCAAVRAKSRDRSRNIKSQGCIDHRPRKRPL